ncbi:MAG: Ig-like domain-containing protein [Ilumatobacteraceae bacterium]
MTRRTRRSIAGSVLVVLGLVIGAVIVTALQAEGRERSRADTNDGGAWLLKRDQGYVGHVNRVVGEVTSAVSASDPGSDYDVDQAQGVVVVHDRTRGAVTVVDDSVERIANPGGLQIDAATTVHAIDGGALVVDRSSMAVWKLDRDALISATSLDGIEPIITGEGATLSAATPDGHAVFADEAAGRVVFLRPDGSTDTSPDVDLTDSIVSITSLGDDTAVLADPDGDVVVATPDHASAVASAVADATGAPTPLVLQQPGAAGDRVVAVTPSGGIVTVPLAGGGPTAIAQLPGTAPVAPIVYGGCVFAVATSPAVYAQYCSDGDGTWSERQTLPLDGAGSELRLRLVNGWIWINDVDSGAAWVTSPQQRLDRVEDWGNILSQLNDDSNENNTEDKGGEVLTEVNPDDPNAEIVQSDEIDEDGPNRPPIARDDETQTRVDRPIDVDVLANDTDPNGDVLIVTAVEQTGGDAIIDINPDGRGVQVAPAAGYAGPVTFSYTITDGRDESASAVVNVLVTSSGGVDNRPPEAHNDIASTRRGRPTTFDVLANDTDPDGDALVLESIAPKEEGGAPGVLVLDPSGQVVFTPDPNSTSERIELAYTVSDDFGATDEGTVIVSVRLEDANNEPDARNDAGVTVVGKPVRLNVLANDTDPDNDPLFIAQLPTLVRPADQSAAALDLSLTPDGELFFNPATAGTYVFNYSATDGEESDVAQIRIEVGESVENRPPIAVRDDVVIPAGGSRLVYVLANDGDPDGDVVGLVGHTADDGLIVKEVEDVGYLVSVTADAPARTTFRYQISDGKSDPVTATVVVAVTHAVVVNQPPVARADVVEVRAGGRVAVPVIANDYDPEGGALAVVSVTPYDGADTEPGLNGQTADISVDAAVVSSFTLSYTVADDAGNQSSAFLEVRIVPADEVNRPPIARADLSRTRSGVPVGIDVVANDSDPDGDIIAAENIRSQPTGGSARVEGGVVVYAPNDTFVGTDRFTYSLVDAGGEIAVGEVLVGVMPLAGANRAPEAFDDTVQAVAGSAALVFDVLDNDSDPDGDRVLVTQVGAPSSGTTEVVDGGAAVAFTPPADLPAQAGGRAETAFTYSIDDGRGGTASATVTVQVVAATEAMAPIAVDDQIGPLTPGESVEINLLENDLDPDGNPAELVVSSGDPALATRDRGVVRYTAGATSSRHIYTITDPAGLTDTAELAVLVVANRAPLVAPFTGETPANSTITVDLAGQATDPDGDTLFYACCEGQQGGSATTITNGAGQLSVSFDPNDDFAGPATFSYTVDDEQGHTVAGSVRIDVLAPSNRPPAATSTSLAVEAGVTTNIDLSALVTDPDPGDTLTYTITDAARGVAQLSLEGSTVQASASIDQGETTDSFQYTVTDAAGQSATGDVTLTITPPAAPPPLAQGDAATTNQGQAVTVGVLGNDIDPLGRGLQVTSAGSPSGGQTSTDGQQVTFTPNPDFFGTTSFIYRIRDGANVASRESEAQVDVTVIGQPSAPGTPIAVAGNAQATLNWAAPPANGAPIDAYEVAIGGGASQQIGNQTGFTWTGLPNGQAVSFTVRAHNAAGWGPWSGASPAVTPDIEPGRPAAPSVQFADGALLVTWSAPANEGSPITAYDLQIGGNAGAIQRVGNTTSFRWEGLTNGQEYTFMVRAVNAKGEGEFSAASAPEHPLRPPDAPNAPSGERGDKTINVRWSPAGNGGDQIIEYEVQIVSTGTVNRTTATAMTWSNLPNGQPQQFVVRARNRGGWGPQSGPSAAVIPCGVPDQTTNVSAARGDGQAAVSWAAPGNQGCAITGYTIRSSGGQAMSVGGGATSATFAGLSNGTSYTFTVAATNEVGAGAQSPASNAVVPAGPPTAPTGLTATPGIGHVDLAWNAANPNGSPITTYQLQVNGGTWENIGPGTSARRGGLANGTSYSFRVRAVNDVGAGAPSNEASARTPGEPAQVGGLDVSSPGRGQIRATWSAPNDNGDAIIRYEVNLSPGAVVNETDRAHAWNGLQDDTRYTVQVRACNSVGCGAWSGAAAATTPPPPRAVTWSSYGSAVGQPNCSSPQCAFVRARGTGFTPGQSYTVTCHGSVQGAFSGTDRTADGSGVVVDDNACYFGYNESFWVTIGGVESDHRQWPG